MNKPMNIMHVVLSLRCGGLEKLVVDLAAETVKHGHNVRICSLESAGDLSEYARKRGIQVSSMNKKNSLDLTIIWKLFRLIKSEKVDVLNTHNIGPLIYGSLAGKLVGVPAIVSTRHGSGDMRRLNRIFWALNDRIIPVSNDTKKTLLANNDIRGTNIRVIYNGVDVGNLSLKESKECFKKKLNIDQKFRIIGTVGRLAHVKDYKTLLEAFRLAINDKKDVKLVFVGDGEEKESLEGYSRTLGISDNTIFMGFRQDVADIVSSFDIFLLSSLTEGISVALLEAMSLSVPAIVTDVGGNPEVVVDSETGILVPPKDPQKMAEAIRRILKNPDMAKKMGQAGRKRVEEKFSLDRMAREYEAIYEECLSKTRDHRP